MFFRQFLVNVAAQIRIWDSRTVGSVSLTYLTRSLTILKIIKALSPGKCLYFSDLSFPKLNVRAGQTFCCCPGDQFTVSVFCRYFETQTRSCRDFDRMERWTHPNENKTDLNCLCLWPKPNETKNGRRVGQKNMMTTIEMTFELKSWSITTMATQG